jgi:Arc/MetJ family transcription regulator
LEIRVTKRLVDIDDDLLERARHILGTDTIVSTVRAALREVLRRDSADQFLRLAASGMFDPTGAGS